MNVHHLSIRRKLRSMPLGDARDILQANLPPNEFTAIFYADIMQKNLGYIADTQLHCTESMVKKCRASAYRKLIEIYSKR